MARWTSAAATAESTPPDRPQTARESPTCWRMRSTCSSMMPLVVQLGWQPAASRKACRTAVPWSVCITSGWNCTPYSLRRGSSIAATGVAAVWAVTAKPGGAATHVSPCDIQTRWRTGRPASRPPWSPPFPSAPPSGARASSVVAPYSAALVRRTVPPRPVTMSWKP